MDGVRTKKSGSGEYNANEPFGNNNFISIPSDTNPLRLVWLDILSIFALARLLPLVVAPLTPFVSGPLDELSPTWSNMTDMLLHTILIIIQLVLIFALPIMTILFWFLPGLISLAFVLAMLAVTLAVMRLLNGGPISECCVGLPPEGQMPVNDEHELWFFINGITIGKHWLQGNLNLLAKTFQREIVGIHNPTKGMFFDLLECLIQRDLDYKTQDIRQGRSQIRAALSAAATKKVVLILHSQGGIEGSSIVDWLLADLSTDIMSRLEIFTFGNAARHFNNPLLTNPPTNPDQSKGGRGKRVIKHIEHYANSEDLVANIGVLKFTAPEAQPYADGNAFAGQIFKREGTGHLLNMHYLDTMFKMDENGKVDESGNDFMNSLIVNPQKRVGKKAMTNGSQPEPQKTFKEVSRLWQYINGGMPED
ncbi:hypothetical protein N431DRAFT_492592 [Stipitochalara longipes BDJ]|nr:hypothetical protein N431DRAFT_492592 [Stipitochalara longipes BDJ]